MQRFRLMLRVLVVMAAGCGQVHAERVLSTQVNGTPCVPDDSANPYVILSSDSMDAHDSAIMRVVLSEFSLTCGLAALDGRTHDDSDPNPGGLLAFELPVLDEHTLTGVGDPNGVVDAELSGARGGGVELPHALAGRPAERGRWDTQRRKQR